MVFDTAVPWRWLETWSPIGFIVAGLAELVALSLLILDSTTAMTVPELVISVFVLPSLFALFAVGLPGFYPYIADASPRLALGGILATTLGLVSLSVTFVGTVAMDLLGISGFTEEGPFVIGFFVLLFAFFLSMLLYGAASVRSREPSLLVGLLLLFIAVEPGTTLLNDVVGVDVGISLAYVTLGVAGMGFIAVGYLLRTGSATTDRAEPHEMAA